MQPDDDIWDQRGWLTLDHHPDDADVVLPPLTDERRGPGEALRLILTRFVAATPAEQARYTLQLDNGQSYNAQDILELLARQDCPVR